MKKSRIIALVVLIVALSINIVSAEEVQEQESLFPIHNTSTFYEWIDLDVTYLKDNNELYSTSELLDLYMKEVDLLYKQTLKKKSGYVLTNGNAKLFSPSVTGEIHAYSQGIENRNEVIRRILNKEDHKSLKYENKYFRDGRNYSTQREIAYLVNEESLIKNYEDTLTALETNNFPEGFLNGLEIYVSPYKLKNIQGYAHTQNIGGREDYVVIAGGNQVEETKGVLSFIFYDLEPETNKEILLHELGHILASDVFGKEIDCSTHGIFHQDKELWQRYLNLYNAEINALKGNKKANEWANLIGENIAEDYMLYMTNKDIRSKKTNYSYNAEAISNLFTDIYSGYEANSANPFPVTKIVSKGTETPFTINAYKGISRIVTDGELNIQMDFNDSLYKKANLFVLNLDAMDFQEYEFDELENKERNIELSAEGDYSLMVVIQGEGKKVIVTEMDISYKALDLENN